MARDINFGFITGTIYSDPVYDNKNNFSNLYFTIKSDSYINKKDMKQHVDFIDIGIQGAYADKMNNILKKGQSVSIQYYLKYSAWQSIDAITKQTVSRKKIYIVADNVKIMEDKNDLFNESNVETSNF